MEMRKRILISSAFMILISLAALLSVGGVAIHSVLEREQRPEIVALDSDGFAVGEILIWISVVFTIISGVVYIIQNRQFISQT